MFPLILLNSPRILLNSSNSRTGWISTGLSSPEDSAKSPQCEQLCAELIFTLVWTFSIFLNSSQTFTADHASSNFAITGLAPGTFPQLSAKDAIPEDHKNNSTSLLLPDTAQVGTWSSLSSLPKATSKETLSCSSQSDSLWETKLRCVPWWGCSLPVIPLQHSRLRREDGDSCTTSYAQRLLPNPLRGSHPGR